MKYFLCFITLIAFGKSIGDVVVENLKGPIPIPELADYGVQIQPHWTDEIYRASLSIRVDNFIPCIVNHAYITIYDGDRNLISGSAIEKNGGIYVLQIHYEYMEHAKITIACTGEDTGSYDSYEVELGDYLRFSNR